MSSKEEDLPQWKKDLKKLKDKNPDKLKEKEQ